MIVLYRELAGYFVHAMNYLADTHGVYIDIVAYPVKSDAPFRFEFSERIRVHSREEMTEESIIELIASTQPQLIFCGGWSDKEYLKVVRAHQKIPALVGFDKQWLGSLRDRLGSTYLRWAVKPYFKYAFVPGKQQQCFARAMGFPERAIFQGAYICETQRFERLFLKRESIKKSSEKRLVYAGRYAEEKDIQSLWDVFLKLKKAGTLENWTLHCIGTGPLQNSAVKDHSIVHHGFLQGKAMDDIMESGDVFILPSKYEPWGVVVNEFALAGYPLILSTAVGAASALYLENGILFEAGNKSALEAALVAMSQWTEEQLLQMGRKSHQLSSVLDEEQYAQSILKMMKL